MACNVDVSFRGENILKFFDRVNEELLFEEEGIKDSKIEHSLLFLTIEDGVLRVCDFAHQSHFLNEGQLTKKSS